MAEEVAMVWTRPRLLEDGTEVLIEGDRPERGRWKVVGRIAHSGSRDPAYDIVNVRDGRRRVLRASRLTVVRRGRA
jgi:hypothetical protein